MCVNFNVSPYLFPQFSQKRSWSLMTFPAEVRVSYFVSSVILQVRVVGPQHQENRMVQRGRGEAASFGQADAHSVENHRSYHRTYCCPVSGALRIPAVRVTWPFPTFRIISCIKKQIISAMLLQMQLIHNHHIFVFPEIKQHKETMRKRSAMTPGNWNQEKSTPILKLNLPDRTLWTWTKVQQLTSYSDGETDFLSHLSLR